MLTKYFLFPDLDKNYKKFPDYSRFSLTFCKKGLFSRFSRFSRFSKSPVYVAGCCGFHQDAIEWHSNLG